MPAVVAERLSADALRLRFASPPDWEVDIHAEPRFLDRELRNAAVLIPIVMRDPLTVLLTQRAVDLSSHAGQVSFPGGTSDASDRDATATALREAYEEIGLHAGHVQVLGALPIYTTGSAFVVTPVVALVAATAPLAGNPAEVEEIFEVPLAFLMNPANHRRHTMEWAGATRHWLSMPYRDGDRQRYIWGATAGMLRNLYRFLQA